MSDDELIIVHERDDDHIMELSASILAYRTIHGRRFHAETGNASYWAANDEQQNESLDIIHHFMTLVCGHKLYLAPLVKEHVKETLDVGTGTGIWAIDFADTHPDTLVVGTDISAIQPGWVPPNLSFELEDFTQEWTFEPEQFDYVHMRHLYGSVPDWPALFREAYKVTAPGGWVESIEASPIMESDDESIPPDSAVAQWGPIFIEGAIAVDRPFTVVDDNMQLTGITEAGFENIHVVDKKIPIGRWPSEDGLREIGGFVQMALEQDYEGFLTFYASALQWSQERVHLYCAELRHEIRSNIYHTYYRLRIVYAQKPAAESGAESEPGSEPEPGPESEPESEIVREPDANN